MHGTDNGGERNPRAKLAAAEVAEIKRLLRSGMSQYVVAKNFGVTRSAVLGIHLGKTWKWVACAD